MMTLWPKEVEEWMRVETVQMIERMEQAMTTSAMARGIIYVASTVDCLENASGMVDVEVVASALEPAIAPAIEWDYTNYTAWNPNHWSSWGMKKDILCGDFRRAAELSARYEGTHLGDQEYRAEWAIERWADQIHQEYERDWGGYSDLPTQTSEAD